MRYDKMSAFIVMDIVREAAKYPNAIHFEIGQPDLPPSPKVKAALQSAVAADQFSYTESLGLPALREKICRYYQDTYQIEISPQRVLLTPGTSGAFLIAYALTLAKGEKLGLTDPSYPCYKNFAYMMEVEPHFMPVDKSSCYQLTVPQLQAQHEKIRALQISSPANPTGNIYTAESLQALNTYCRQHDIAFISDELYHGLVYEQQAATALQFNPDAYVINGFSKYFCMPGARLGWIIVPEHKVREAEIIAQNIFICAPTLSQYGALAAFDNAYLAQIQTTFRQRRDYLYNELKQLFTIEFKPQGAFYLWADVSRYTDDSYQFAKEMLAEIQVATTPGIDFGNNGTHHYLRFAYTRDIEHMRKGIARLKAWLKNREKSR
ncbi:Aspartate/methionine/tyrosine aminotransferase [Pasteurella testudinis DSM 23072]|uniref:Aspartate/methionine/tyrosine aminotransferase n=1 Tax=Pasteurella testudinis DSM 23072 TaxID=1122938 RepID=A0A1W1VAA8_9PAST|nr:aminotransferase class I/II-fold pyridoxal phosphate-dependent enzyme [Pasteurella testudinis]SMB90255.1 Aspartate/methionine/tyrosine aminotransferase [Pasteurella testudinis DSM 23072]SUB51368.1 aminotransferase [Pasteurella testudinis]